MGYLWCKYRVIKILQNFISAELCDNLTKKIKQYEQPVGDKLVSNSFSAYALPETEELLGSLTNTIGTMIGKQLYPTYSYCRIYYTGATMPPHTDRHACEISMSLCVGGESWPLWFKDYGPVTLQPGSAVLYPGPLIEHWREKYTGNGCTQVFLHWVDANGPFADWQYDRRPALGSKETEKNYWGKS
jgi:hypothetical protein